MELNDQNKALLDAIYKRFDESERKITEELNNLKIINEQLKKRVVETEKKIEVQNETILQLEKRLNNNNLIIHGMEEKENDEVQLEENITGFLNNKLGVELKTDNIQQVYRIGKINNQNKPRPVKLNLSNYRTKEMITSQRRKLAGTSVFINDDLPKELRLRAAEKRRKLVNERGIKRYLNESAEQAQDLEDRITQDNKRINGGKGIGGKK